MDIGKVKTIIISGGFGFLGRHIIEYISENNLDYKVIVISRKLAYFNSAAETIIDSLTDSSLLYSKISSIGGEYASAFIHLAWNGVSTSQKNSISEQVKNINCSICALETAKLLQCGCFINIGTVAEYVEVSEPISEKQKPCPLDLYGATKVAVHYILEAYARQIKQPYINTILASTYGEYRNDDNVISYTIKSLLNGITPSYGSLQQIWDFLYVKDAAKAILLLSDRGIHGKSYGIGSGFYQPLEWFIKQTRDSIDPRLDLNIGSKGDKYKKILNSCVDITDIQADTGFTPDYSFQQGIENTISYFKNLQI